MRLVERLDCDRRVTAVPYQKPGVPTTAGLTLQECKEASWAVSSDGRRYRSAGAVNVSLAVAIGTTLPLLVYALPGLRRLEDLAYDLIATNRNKLPGVEPYCKQYPEECK